MPRLVFSERARYDLLRLRSFLAEDDPTRASAAIATIRRELTTLTKTPRLGRPVDTYPNAREWIMPFGRLAYLALYHVEEDQIIIVSIRHSREAGY